MPEPVTSGATASLVKFGGEVIKIAAEQGWFDKLLGAFKKRHRVLLLGSSGAGKSQFITSLLQAAPEAIDAMNRTEFVEHKKFNLGGLPFEFIDTPGQLLHSSRRSAAMREAMRKPIAGILNVVSYGFHEHRHGHERAIHGDAVSADYLETHRRLEIEALSEWVELLGHWDVAGWLLTVVTKADLWWPMRQQVLEHYETGPYAAALGRARELRPSVVEYCSVFHKFYGIAPISGRVDEGDRVRLRNNMLATLLAGVRGQK